MNRALLCFALLFAVSPALPRLAAQSAPAESNAPQKVIFDTDIGDDIDDAFALALALSSPKLQVVGVTTAWGDTDLRARLVARFLAETGHADIPVAAGPKTDSKYPFTQKRWALAWPQPANGWKDAIDFTLDQIRKNPGQITLISVSPFSNVGALIDRDPATFRKLKKVVIMGGSIHRGYGDLGYLPSHGPDPEYNILLDIPSARKLFASGVPLYVMPLDSTQLKLQEVLRNTLFSQGTPTTDALALLYAQWTASTLNPTPTLFDAMAVAAAIDPALCPTQPMHIDINDKGYTRQTPGQANAQVCLNSSSEKFFDFYVHTLLHSDRKPALAQEYGDSRADADHAAADVAAAHSQLLLKDGDRVVFYGDSITAQRLYTRFTEDFLVSRYPGMRLHFYNAGVSGDTVTGGHAGDMLTRVKRDVVPFRPTVVTIMLGMNDGRYTTDFDANYKAYQDGYRKLIAALRQSVPGARLILIRPSPYDEVGHVSAIPGYGSVIERYGDFVASLGKQLELPVIDLNRPMRQAVREGMQVDPNLAGALLPDRIHPSPAGHWIMAAALAEGLHLDPYVSSLTLRMPEGKAENAHNTSVSQIKAAPNEISWVQQDSALPLPLELNDSFVHFLLRISSLEQTDRQILRIKGLTAPRYTLTIDNEKIGSFSTSELESGINLAVLQTPMEQQAKAIDWTAEDRTRVSGARFDLLTEDAPIAKRADGIAALDSLDDQMLASEYKSAQPKARTFKLIAEPVH